MVPMTIQPRQMPDSRDVVPVVKQARAQSTIDQLIEATIEALEQHGESGLRLDDIFESTGVARSSMYHHFGDREGLIDAARVVMFTRSVDANIRTLEGILNEATTFEEFRQGTRTLSTISQAPGQRTGRLRRAYTIGASDTRPGLAAELATAQRRLTETITGMIERAQDKGWVRQDLDAAAIAVFVQAYPLGRVVSDIDLQQVDPEAWLHLVFHVVESALLTNETE